MNIPAINAMNTNLTSKKILFLIVSFLYSFLSFSQQDSFREMLNVTYSIENGRDISDENAYINALNTANMNNHRLRSSRNTIQFETGVKVILFSAEEVFANGVINFTPIDFPYQIENYTPPVFRLVENNFIIELKKTVHSKGH